MNLFKINLLNNILDNILSDNISNILQIVEKFNIKDKFYSYQFTLLTLRNNHNHVFKYLLEESKNSFFLFNTYSDETNKNHNYKNSSYKWNPTNKIGNNSTDIPDYYNIQIDGDIFMVKVNGDNSYIVHNNEISNNTDESTDNDNYFKQIYYDLFHEAINHNNNEAFKILIEDERISKISEIELMNNYNFLDYNRYEIFRLIMCSPKISKKYKEDLLFDIIEDRDLAYNDMIKDLINDVRFFNSKIFSLSKKTLNKLIIRTLKYNNHELFEFFYNNDIINDKIEPEKILYSICKYNGFKSYRFFIKNHINLLKNSEMVDKYINTCIKNDSPQTLDYILQVKNTTYNDEKILRKIIDSYLFNIYSYLARSKNIDIFINDKQFFKESYGKLSNTELINILNFKPLPDGYEFQMVLKNAIESDNKDVFKALIENEAFNEKNINKKFKDIIVKNADFVYILHNKYPSFTLDEAENIKKEMLDDDNLLSYCFKHELIDIRKNSNEIIGGLVNRFNGYSNNKHFKLIIEILKKDKSIINKYNMNKIKENFDEKLLSDELKKEYHKIIRKKKIKKFI